MTDPTGIYELHLQLIEIINGLWEIWLGFTFAYLVAFHIGRNSITKTIFWIACTLYVLASLGVLLRYIDYIYVFTEYDAILVKYGLPPHPRSQISTSGSLALLSVVVIFSGTAASVWYSFKMYVSARKSNDA